MATLPTSAHRLLLAGGFAVAASAAPVLITLAAPAGPDSPALATCPSTEVFDPATGACKPLTDPSPDTLNVDPGVTALTPGAITESGQLPEVNGVPCNGQNTGLCMGLMEDNANAVTKPEVPTGVTG